MWLHTDNWKQNVQKREIPDPPFAPHSQEYVACLLSLPFAVWSLTQRSVLDVQPRARGTEQGSWLPPTFWSWSLRKFISCLRDLVLAINSDNSLFFTLSACGQGWQLWSAWDKARWYMRTTDSDSGANWINLCSFAGCHLGLQQLWTSLFYLVLSIVNILLMFNLYGGGTSQSAHKVLKKPNNNTRGKTQHWVLIYKE